MSKRKATKSQKDESGAKKLRTTGGASSAASVAATSAASSSADSLDSAIRRADLIPSIAIHTLQLVDSIKPDNESHTVRMQALIVLMKADADRPESLLDWSLVPTDDEVSAQHKAFQPNLRLRRPPPSVLCSTVSVLSKFQPRSTCIAPTARTQSRRKNA